MLSYMLPVSEKPPIPPTANLATGGGGGGGTTARLQLALGDAATAATPPPPPPTANSNSNNNNNSPPMPNGGPAPAARQPQLPTRQQLQQQQQPPPGVGLVAPPTHQPPLPPHAGGGGGGGGSSLPTDSSVSSLSSSEVGTTPSSQSTATPTDARPRNKLQANGKHPTLKRVSFGSSKGSMVETLVYESPLREEPEAISPSPEAASAALLAGPGADPEALAEWLKRFSLSSELRRRRLRVRHPRKSRPPGSARRRPG
ncbi:hypothetical protein R5R35_013595 [Gryllus longicercus]|uniref:Uncharacterized protein n=1 Tax=Gryllus longicercus TaxID=2509291 RepID=A0AAN9YXW0_9ORTH